MKNFSHNRVLWPIFGARRELRAAQQRLDARAELRRLSLLDYLPTPAAPQLRVITGTAQERTAPRGHLTLVESVASVEQLGGVA